MPAKSRSLPEGSAAAADQSAPLALASVPPHPPSDHAAMLHSWMRLSERLAHCTKSLQENWSRQAAAHGLGHWPMVVLWACHQQAGQPPSQGDLAELLGVSSAHISGLVEQLRQQGLLEGRRDPADRRRQTWRLTAAGQTTMAMVINTLGGWAEGLETHLSARRRRSLERLLARLSQALAATSSAPPSAAGKAAARPMPHAAHDGPPSPRLSTAVGRKGVA